MLSGSEKNNMKLSIIIVNYNGKRFFEGCLRSIADNVKVEHEIIVVDNASADGSVDYLRNNHPDVNLIESDSNLGFAKGNNLAALSAKGDFLLLLNNDVLLLDDLLPVLSLIEKDDSVGVLGVRMLGVDKRYRYSAGFFPEPWRLLKFSSLYNTRGRLSDGDFTDMKGCYSVDWVEGSFLLTRTDVWKRIGGLDEDYFMYVEDMDFARRVVDLGMKVLYCPEVSYIHFGGFNQQRIGMLVNGFRKYHKKHSGMIKRLFANFVLDTGLIARGILHLAYSSVVPAKKGSASLYFQALRRGRDGTST